MSKLTKPQILAHEKALELVARGNLSHDETLFIFENYQESANHINSKSGAFFTPFGLAQDFSLHVPYMYHHSIRILDLCAGIGVLSYATLFQNFCENDYHMDVTCVETNPDYVAIGKKLLPQATWICGDALDVQLLHSLGLFDFVMANPPFGIVPSQHKNEYSTNFMEYCVIEAGAQVADFGVFILPQMSAPFIYSGTENKRWLNKGRARSFEEKSGIALEFNIGVDTAMYKHDWHGIAPLCEIVCCEFTNCSMQLNFATSA